MGKNVLAEKNKNSFTHKDVVIHVGLPKTGTTFLQKEVFPKLDINFYHLSRVDELDLDFELENNITNLISYEGLSVDPTDFNSHHCSSQERMEIAKKIHLLFPYARIIVGIRDKKDWLNSLYKHYERRTGSLIDFKAFKNKFDDSFLDFERYINFLEQNFPEVYVYNFEELKEDYQAFVDNICSFIGVEAPQVDNVVYNKGFTKGQLELIHALHKVAIKGYRVFISLIDFFNRRSS